MTRRRRVAPRKPQVRQLPWSDVAALFPYGAGLQMQPPAEVSVRLNSKSWTYTAVFTDEQGRRWIEAVRLDPVRKVCISHDITMKVSFLLKGRR